MIIPHHDKSRKRKKKNLTKKLSIFNAYINFKLSKVSNSRAKEVREILDENKAERHIRGGMATKMKYKKNHEMAIDNHKFIS